MKKECPNNLARINSKIIFGDQTKTTQPQEHREPQVGKQVVAEQASSAMTGNKITGKSGNWSHYLLIEG